MSANRARAQVTVRNWNENFPPGTEVIYNGKPAKTWSWAGLGDRFTPVVFLEEIELPVPLCSLEVPGWTMGPRRR